MIQYSGSFVTVFSLLLLCCISVPVNYGNSQWASIIYGSATAGPPSSDSTARAYRSFLRGSSTSPPSSVGSLSSCGSSPSFGSPLHSNLPPSTVPAGISLPGLLAEDVSWVAGAVVTLMRSGGSPLAGGPATPGLTLQFQVCLHLGGFILSKQGIRVVPHWILDLPHT